MKDSHDARMVILQRPCYPILHVMMMVNTTVITISLREIKNIVCCYSAVTSGDNRTSFD